MGFGMGLMGRGFGRMGAAPSKGVSYLPEASALFARMSVQPDGTRKALINSVIKSLQAAGVWTKLDALYLLAAHSAQAARLNLVQDLYNCTAVSSPSFTTDRGYTGDGSAAHLNTGFNPAIASSPKMVQDSMHLGVWMRTDPVFGGGGDIGNTNAEIRSAVSGDGTGKFVTAARASSGAGTTDFVSGDPVDVGHASISRTASGTYKMYRNGLSFATPSRASTGVSNDNVLILRTPVGSFSQGQASAAHIGSGLTDAEIASLYSSINTYLTAIGAA